MYFEDFEVGAAEVAVEEACYWWHWSGWIDKGKLGEGGWLSRGEVVGCSERRLQDAW